MGVGKGQWVYSIRGGATKLCKGSVGNWRGNWGGKDWERKIKEIKFDFLKIRRNGI